MKGTSDLFSSVPDHTRVGIGSYGSHESWHTLHDDQLGLCFLDGIDLGDCIVLPDVVSD